VLVVVTPEVPCIRRTKAALTLMQKWGYSRDKVKLVVNRSQKKGEVSLAEIEQVLEYPVYAQFPEDAAVAKSISIGTPVAMFDPKGKAGRAANDLTRSLTGLPTPQRTGLLRRQRKAKPQVQRRWAPASAGSSSMDDSWLNGGSNGFADPGHQPNGSGESTPGGVAWEFDWQTGLERPAGEPHNGAHPNGNGPATWLNGHGEHGADPFGDTVVTAGHAERGDWPPRAQGE